MVIQRVYHGEEGYSILAECRGCGEREWFNMPDDQSELEEWTRRHELKCHSGMPIPDVAKVGFYCWAAGYCCAKIEDGVEPEVNQFYGDEFSLAYIELLNKYGLTFHDMERHLMRELGIPMPANSVFKAVPTIEITEAGDRRTEAGRERRDIPI